MPDDSWQEDDQPGPQRRRGFRWWHVVALGGVCIVGVLALSGLLFPEKMAGGWRDWQFKQFRRDILNGSLPADALRDELLKRDNGLLIALRLSEDPNPRVRAAAIERLIARGTPVRKQEPSNGHVDHLSTTLGESDANEALLRLLDDPDASVRTSAIRAVSSIEEKLAFIGKLESILQTGSSEERIAVCEYLAGWDGDQVLKTFANPRQPTEVRLAAIRSANRFGWARVIEDRAEFLRVMKAMQGDPDESIRTAAKDALQQAGQSKSK
jgi:hypothetical protein